MKKVLSASLRACDVTRWHTVNTAKKQTLADHMWAVTVITMTLYEKLIGETPASVITDALVHDLEEVWRGDTPAPHKETVGGRAMPYADEAEAILKVADTLEALWWVKNNAIGSYTANVVVADCEARLNRRVKQAAEQFFGDAITGAVAELRTEMG